MNPARSPSASRHGRTGWPRPRGRDPQTHESDHKYENRLRAVAIALLGGRRSTRRITLTLGPLLAAALAGPAVACESDPYDEPLSSPACGSDGGEVDCHTTPDGYTFAVEFFLRG